ncbi:MAG: hypothetical protein OEZ10_12755 [Gammaproteobacteria bacterium]|nr:hypothetical protein [Gammaproteobacteria bacterium]
MPARQPVYLIDASIFIFRGWFGIPDSLRNGNGMPVNALTGFGHFIADFLAATQARRLAAFFDESLGSSFRHELYPNYKSNREYPPVELERQFQLCKQLLKLLGIRCFASRRYEADDLIASAAYRLRSRGWPVTIVSADKDLAQCLESSRDRFWNFGKSDPQDASAIARKLGVAPPQIADYLALAGDSVDCIPGIKGVGRQTASRLLKHYSSLDNLLNHAGPQPDLGIRGQAAILKRIKQCRGELAVYRKLTGLKRCCLTRQQANEQLLSRRKMKRSQLAGFLESELRPASRLTTRLLSL